MAFEKYLNLILDVHSLNTAQSDSMRILVVFISHYKWMLGQYTEVNHEHIAPHFAVNYSYTGLSFWRKMCRNSYT
jgi:hypothetical protein